MALLTLGKGSKPALLTTLPQDQQDQKTIDKIKITN